MKLSSHPNGDTFSKCQIQVIFYVILLRARPEQMIREKISITQQSHRLKLLKLNKPLFSNLKWTLLTVSTIIFQYFYYFIIINYLHANKNYFLIMTKKHNFSGASIQVTRTHFFIKNFIYPLSIRVLFSKKGFAVFWKRWNFVNCNIWLFRLNSCRPLV